MINVPVSTHIFTLEDHPNASGMVLSETRGFENIGDLFVSIPIL
jgi:hypothetical protein